MKGQVWLADLGFGDRSGWLVQRPGALAWLQCGGEWRLWRGRWSQLGAEYGGRGGTWQPVPPCHLCRSAQQTDESLLVHSPSLGARTLAGHRVGNKAARGEIAAAKVAAPAAALRVVDAAIQVRVV